MKRIKMSKQHIPRYSVWYSALSAEMPSLTVSLCFLARAIFYCFDICLAFFQSLLAIPHDFYQPMNVCFNIHPF